MPSFSFGSTRSSQDVVVNYDNTVRKVLNFVLTELKKLLSYRNNASGG